MFIDGADPRNADVLLAFEGEVIGRVKEAFVAPKEHGGYILQYRWAEDDNDIAIEPVRREGNVAYLGSIGREDMMPARRLSEERQRLGLPYPHADVPKEVTQRDLHAANLESLAMQIRNEVAVVTNVETNCAVDRLPLPVETGGGFQFQPTGKLSYEIRYDHKDVIAAHERAVKEWSAAHPELVPDYVRSKAEGPR